VATLLKLELAAAAAHGIRSGVSLEADPVRLEQWMGLFKETNRRPQPNFMVGGAVAATAGENALASIAAAALAAAFAASVDTALVTFDST